LGGYEIFVQQRKIRFIKFKDIYTFLEIIAIYWLCSYSMCLQVPVTILVWQPWLILTLFNGGKTL